MQEIRFLEYRSTLAYNRHVFSIEHGDLLKAFVAIEGNFPTLIELPQTRRDRNKRSWVSMIPLLLLLERQALAAFELLTADESYQAWLLLRPGIEATLIIGKWIEDPASAKIWENKDKDPRSYRKAYMGKALQSTALPGSDVIQAALGKINDRFVHTNTGYYHRHLDVAPGDPGYVNVLLTYHEDDPLQLANAFAFLHLVLMMQDALLAAFNGLFGTEATLPTSLAVFRERFGNRIAELARTNSEYRAVLTDLGIWGESLHEGAI